MPQVHIIGEIASAEDFAVRSTLRPLATAETKLKCVWELQTGQESWTLLQGSSRGVSPLCAETFKEPVAWTQPIDAHFSTTSLRGWPKLFLEVWHEDEYGRCELSGYGMVHVPSAPGEYELECVTWLPKGSLREEIYKYFLGYVPRLEQPELVTKPSSRFDLFSRSSGRIAVKLNVLVSGMQSQGVVLKET